MLKSVSVTSTSAIPDHKSIEKLKAHFEKNPPVIGSQAPNESKRTTMKLSNFMAEHLPVYQRAFELQRLKGIIASIIRFGPIAAFTIILTKAHEIFDGRHRALAFYVLGTPIVPVLILEFKSDQDEIQCFNSINSGVRPLKPDQRLLNDFQAGEPLAVTIYDLGFRDPQSKWADKIALIADGIINKNDKMTCTNFAKVLNWIGFGLKRRMEGESYLRAVRKLEKTSYEVIRSRLNEFHDWYYKFATPIKVKNDVFHKEKVLISMLEFFYSAQRQNSTSAYLKKEKILENSLSRFARYNFRDLTMFDAATAPDSLFNHYNDNKTHKIERV